jgi:hypothetical protein
MVKVANGTWWPYRHAVFFELLCELDAALHDTEDSRLHFADDPSLNFRLFRQRLEILRNGLEAWEEKRSKRSANTKGSGSCRAVTRPSSSGNPNKYAYTLKCARPSPMEMPMEVPKVTPKYPQLARRKPRARRGLARPMT